MAFSLEAKYSVRDIFCLGRETGLLLPLQVLLLKFNRLLGKVKTGQSLWTQTTTIFTKIDRPNALPLHLRKRSNKLELLDLANYCNRHLHKR